MGQVKGQGHIIIRFVAGIAKHHTLVAGSLFFFFLFVYSLVDIGRLLMDGRKDTAGVRFEHIFALGIADLTDNAAGNLLHVEVSLRFYFSGQNDLSSSYEGFASDFGLGVKSEEVVDQCIGYLVGYFVGVTFRYALRSE